MAFKYKNELKTKTERAILPAIFDIDRLESSLHLKLDKQVKDKVLREYGILYKKGFTNGRRREDVLKVLVYITLRNLERPVMSRDLGMSQRVFNKYLRKILLLLELKLKQKSFESYVLRFGSSLHLKQSTISVAMVLSKIKVSIEFDTHIFAVLSVASSLMKDSLDLEDFAKDKYFVDSCEKIRRKIKGKILEEVEKYTLVRHEKS